MAYGRIYANKGAMTPGVTGETVDGMSLEKIDAIIGRLHTQLRTTEEWRRLAPTIPLHGRSAVADILSACADDLKGMAQELRCVEGSLTG